MSGPTLSLESVTCGLCGSEQFDVVWPAALPPRLEPAMFSYAGGKRYHGRVVRCRDCGLRYVNPRPRLTRELYARVEDPHYEATRDARRRTFLRVLTAMRGFVPASGSLLDLGCATGPFLEVARDAGYRVRGVEPSSWASRIAQGRGLPVENCGVEQLRTDERFDIVTCFDVLEHVDRPLPVARRAFDLLRPGGQFIVSVPDFGRWHIRLLGRFHWLVVLMHYFYFEAATLRALLERAGFVDVRIETAPAVTMSLADAAVWFDRWGPVGSAATRAFRHSIAGRPHVSVIASLLGAARRPPAP